MDDTNFSPPSEGSEPKKPNGKKPYHKHNNRRKPEQTQFEGVQVQDSPNGAINVRPGRYDLPPKAVGNDGAKRPYNDKTYKPKHNKKPQNHSEHPQKNPPADAAPQTAADEPETSDLLPVQDQTSQSQQKRRPRNQRGKRGTNQRDNSELDVSRGKTVSAEVIDLLAKEEAEINEYVAVAGISAADPLVVDPLNTDDIDLSSDTSESPSDLIADITDPPEIFTPEDENRLGVIPENDILTAPEIPTVAEPPLETFEIVGVRFKSGGKIYYFDPDGMKFAKSDSVIVDTARGLEFGTVDLSNRRVTEREVVLPLRKVIRAATDEDIERARSNVERAAEAFDICIQKIADHKLEMKLVDVEYTFDNSKLLFYFTADGRIDFRDLVKDLAAVFRTRIELRQIGIRDETKLIGGIGICGRPFCCKTFLSDFVQVSIKMAKEQNLSLNSVKISGACGRLMCCLRYEYDTYQEEIRRTPKVDQTVSTPDGNGTVIEVQPLAGLVRVRFTDKLDTPPKVFRRDEVTVIGGKNAVKPKPIVRDDVE